MNDPNSLPSTPEILEVDELSRRAGRYYVRRTRPDGKYEFLHEDGKWRDGVEDNEVPTGLFDTVEAANAALMMA